MISDSIIKTLEIFASKYQQKGYQRHFVVDEKTNKYELRLEKSDKTLVIRDGFYRGEFTKGEARITSFDVLLTVESSVFAQYFSDYPLEEYELRLGEAINLIDAFDRGDYTITSEKTFFGKKKLYLNIEIDGETYRLLGKALKPTL